MFLFGGGGGGGGAASSDPAVLQRLLAEKDEEIEDLNAKVAALREALEKDEMDDFEKAIAEKNKVLEEAFAQIEELKVANAQMAQQLAAGVAPPVQLPQPPASQSAAAEGALADGDDAAAAAASADAAVAADPTVHSQLQVQLAAEQQARLQAEDYARQAAQAANELQAQLVAMQEQVAQLQEGDSARVQAENQDLRARLANTIGKAIEAQQALAAQRGEPQEVTHSLSLLLEEGISNIGTIFATRDLRQLGHGWPVHRVREGSWAEGHGVREGDELHGMNGYPVEVMPEMEVIDLLQTRPLQLDWVRRQPAAEQAPASAGAGLPPEATGPPKEAPAAVPVPVDTQPAEASVPHAEDEQVRLAKEEAEKARADAAQAAAVAQQSLQETLSLLQASREEGDRLKQQLEAAVSARALEEAHEQVKCLKDAVQVAADQEEAVRQEAKKLQLNHEEELGKLRLEVEMLQSEREALQRQAPRMPSGVGDDETDGWEGDVSDRNEVSTPAALEGASRIAELETQLSQKERETEEALAENRDLESHLASLREEVTAAEGELARAGELQEKLAKQEERAEENQQLLEESRARVVELEKQLLEQAAGSPSGAAGVTSDGWEPELEVLQAPAPSPVEPRSPRVEMRNSPSHQTLAVPEVTAVAAQQMEAVSTQLPAMLRELEEELRQARQENAALRAAQETPAPAAQQPVGVTADDSPDAGWDLDIGLAVPDVPKLTAEELVEQLKDDLQQAVDELATARADGRQLRESLGAAEAEVSKLRAQQQQTLQASPSAAPAPAAAAAAAGTGDGDGWGDFALEVPGSAEQRQPHDARPTAESASTQVAVSADGPADGGWDLGEDLMGAGLGGAPEETQGGGQHSAELAELRGQLAETQAVLKQAEDQAGQASKAAQEAAARSAMELEELREELDKAKDALRLATEEAGKGLRAAEEQAASAREEAELQQARATQELVTALQQAKARTQSLEESLQLTQQELSQLQESQKAPATAAEAEGPGSSTADGWGLDLLDASPPEVSSSTPELETVRQELTDARNTLSVAEQQLDSLRTEAQQQQAAAQQEVQKAAAALEEANTRTIQLQEALGLAQEEVRKLKEEVPEVATAEQTGLPSADGWGLDLLDAASPPDASVSSQELEVARQELADARTALSATEQQLGSLRTEAQQQEAAAQQEAKKAAVALEEATARAKELQEALDLSQQEVRKLKEVPAAAPAELSGPSAGDGWDLDDLEGPTPPAPSQEDLLSAAENLESTQKELSDARAALSTSEQQLIALRQEALQHQAASQEDARQAALALEESKSQATELREALQLSQEEVKKLKEASAAVPAATPQPLQSQGSADGWDLEELEAPAGSSPEDTQSARDLELAQKELSDARATVTAAEAQLDSLRDEMHAQQAAARQEVAQAEAALKLAQEELAQVKAAQPAAPPPQETDLLGADGWDLDGFDGPAAKTETLEEVRAQAGQQLEEVRQELAEARANLGTAEQQLISLRDEAKQQKASAEQSAAGFAEATNRAKELQLALQEAMEEVEQLKAAKVPAQPQAPLETGGLDTDGADGWDLNLGVEETTASPSRSAADLEDTRREMASLQEANKKLEEQLGCLRTENETLKAAEEASRQSTQPAATQPQASTGADDDGWDFDIADVAPAPATKADDSSKALEVAKKELAEAEAALKLEQDRLTESEKLQDGLRKELAVSQAAAKESEQQLLAYREEIAHLKAAATAVQSSTVPPAAPSGGQADDGWDDFDLDMEQAPASPTRKEETTPPAPVAPSAPAATGGDDDGWEFDLPTEPREAQPAPVASTGETAAEDGQQALEEARRALADAQAALKLAEDRAEAAEGLRQQLAEAEASAIQLREESSQQKRRGEEASEKVEQLEDALMLAARELKSAREEVAELKVAAAEPPAASGAGKSLPADGGWDFDLEGDAAPTPATEAVTVADLNAAKEALEQAHGKIRGLEDALQKAQDQLASSASAKAPAPAASLTDDGWDFDAAETAGTPAATAVPTTVEVPAAAPTSKQAGNDGWGDDGWDFFDDSAKPAPQSSSSVHGLSQESEQKSLQEKQAALEQAQMQAQESQAAFEQQAAALEKAQKEEQQRSLELEQMKLEAATAREALEETSAEKDQLKKALKEVEEKLAKAESATAVTAVPAPAPADDDGWDFDLDAAPAQATAPASAPDSTSGEMVRLQEALRSRESELEQTKQELAASQTAVQGSEQQLLQCQEEIAQLKAAAAAAQSSAATPSATQPPGTASDGWDDFALEIDQGATAPSPAPGPPAKADDDLGWDLDLGDDAAPPPAASPALQEEALRKAEEAASEARVEEQKANEAKEAAEQEAKRLQAALKSTEEKLKASEAERVEGKELHAALARAREQLEAAQAETTRLKAEKEELLSRTSAAAGTAPAADDDGWDFDLSQEEAASTKAPEHSSPPGGHKAAQPPAQSTSGQEAGGAGDDGWDFDSDGDDSKDKDAGPQQQKAVTDLITKLDVANGRVKHLEDELQAERVVNGTGTAAQLRTEVASLSEALARERQEREREEAHLGQLVRRAQEDLREQAAAARASAGAEADSAHLLEQLESLRQQRDQARSIAQCIARQTSVLAEELYRLRVSSDSDAQHPSAGVQPLGSVRDPERTLLRGANSHPAEEDQPEAAVAPEVPDGPGSSSSRAVPSRTRPAGYSDSTPQASRATAPNEDGDDLQPPRPSVEVTSGWDVFDPDDQFEHTIPTSLGCAEGWDTGMEDLLDGRTPGTGSAAAGPAPELSPASPADAGMGARTQASPGPGSADLDLELLLGDDLT